MRKFLKKLLGALLTRLAYNASSPDKAEVNKSLSKLLRSIKESAGKRGIVINTDFTKESFIIFSDHHKGNKDHGDDFASNEPNYLAALEYFLELTVNILSILN